MRPLFCHIKSKKGVIKIGGYDDGVFYSRKYAKKCFAKSKKIFVIFKTKLAVINIANFPIGNFLEISCTFSTYIPDR